MMRVKHGRRFPGTRAHRVISVIFDVNTVVDSTRASATAWKLVFDPFLRSYAVVHETGFVSFDARADYRRYIHGRLRLAGARDFLASRDITLPFDDLRGLAMSQEKFFLGQIRGHGLVAPGPTVAFIGELRGEGIRTAAVSAPRYGIELLGRARVAGLFDVILAGPDTPRDGACRVAGLHLFLEAARRLGAPVERTAVIDESAGGIAAARAGGFGAVIAVDRTGGAVTFEKYGADLVVTDLSQLRPRGRGRMNE